MKNRIVALPVHTGFAYPDGRVSPWMVKFYTGLAKSGVGMVIVANTAVAKDGIVSRFNLRADKDEFIPGLARLATAIKQKGAIACLQLNHAGRFAKTNRPLLPSPITSSNLTFNVESLKRFMEFFPFEKRLSLTRHFINQLKAWRQAMTDQDRDRVIKDFGSAALRAVQAGFDMIELHGANGYLLCQYLSSFTNQIKTGFGGDFQGRTAFPLAVIKEVKNRVPRGVPLGFRIILREWVPDGVDLPEALAFASLLEKEGVSYLSASAGTYNSIFSPAALKKMAKTSYLKDEMKKLKTRVGIPTIASGRITTPSLADKMIREGITELIGLGRPLRTDPLWVEKAIHGDKKIITCVNCNQCLKRVVLEQGFNCSRWPQLIQDRTRLEHRLLTRNHKALWVICNLGDIQTFKQAWPLIAPDIKGLSYPSIITLKTFMEDKAFDLAQMNFIRWIQARIDPLGFTNAPLKYVIREHRHNWENSLLDKIADNGHGQVFIGSNHGEPWRERLLYKQRGKVMARIQVNKYLQNVIVPVDFSPATLLVMIFVRRTLMQKKGFSFSFIHVVTGRSGTVEPQWKKMKKITDFDENIPLKVITAKSDIASTLVETIKTKKYGTVIMGKRGLSGIKRWLLGSVSASVLNHLTDQTLFLID